MDEKKKNEVITSETVIEAEARRKKYAAGKKSIDEKASANQKWWRGRHWSEIKKQNESMKDAEKPTSAWLFNSIINKHADMMDNYPKPNVLPRSILGQEDAQILRDRKSVV